jgi:hypothetical protein
MHTNEIKTKKFITAKAIKPNTNILNDSINFFLS